MHVIMEIVEICFNQHTGCIDELIESKKQESILKNRKKRKRQNSNSKDSKEKPEMSIDLSNNPNINDEKIEDDSPKTILSKIKFNDILSDNYNKLWFTLPVINVWLNIFLFIVHSQHKKYKENKSNNLSVKNGLGVLYPQQFEINNQPLFIYFLNLISNPYYTSMLPIKKMLIYIRWHICMSLKLSLYLFLFA